MDCNYIDKLNGTFNDTPLQWQFAAQLNDTVISSIRLLRSEMTQALRSAFCRRVYRTFYVLFNKALERTTEALIYGPLHRTNTT